MNLPKREHDEPEWQAAIEALMLVFDLGGPTMFARIGVCVHLTSGITATARTETGENSRVFY